jgi:OPA family glycerol-3-phosphate transporter-like MFS transporter
MVFTLRTPWYVLGGIVAFMSLSVIGVHGMLSGTSTMDFGGRKSAATAVGLIDGFVYLGTGVQSISLGFLTTANWNYWPPFLIPFAVIGLVLAIRIWYAFPQPAKKREGH